MPLTCEVWPNSRSLCGIPHHSSRETPGSKKQGVEKYLHTVSEQMSLKLVQTGHWHIVHRKRWGKMMSTGGAQEKPHRPSKYRMGKTLSSGPCGNKSNLVFSWLEALCETKMWLPKEQIWSLGCINSSDSSLVFRMSDKKPTIFYVGQNILGMLCAGSHTLQHRQTGGIQKMTRMTKESDTTLYEK